MTGMMYISQIWIFLGALVSSNALHPCLGRCENVTVITVNASMKSGVFLPCHFDNKTRNKTERVEWSHLSSLLRITQDGNIDFNKPREGRVNVFPILAYKGNFSILIHDLQPSDLGTYCCELSRECWRVEIIESPHPAEKSNEIPVNPWLYFAAGAGLFILLFIAFSLFSQFWGNCVNGSSKSNPVHGVQNEGNNPPEEIQKTRSGEHRNNNSRGVIRGNTTVYENDQHAPNQISEQRAFRPVPEPTTSHQSTSNPYYVNQAELSIPSNVGKKRKKPKHMQIKNPIYGD
ncbi:uncharacterized protein LOC127421976 [Myxocyprinus asiaticus]|uniref:uncharacterized protein LOC127421976 n=1 Tax=Myxocyprinus asiaticus TaxID=70543 RepID=UPI002222F18C|nr:uncharacterized protein LOC127421976 [Myxocyprinus asiaticus]